MALHKHNPPPRRSSGREPAGGQSGPMRGANTGTTGGGGVDGSAPAGSTKRGGGGGAPLRSDVSGFKAPGKGSTPGMGGRSPTAERIADQATGGVNKKQTTNLPGRHNP